MKNSQKSILGMLSLALVFTSCQKDSLVDMDLLSNENNRLEDVQQEHQQDSRSIFDTRTPEPNTSSNAFELSQRVSIERPDCLTNSSQEKSSDEARGSSRDCYGKYNLSSNEGRGWVEEMGSFTTIVDLDYDPVSKEVKGSVTLEFDGEQPRIVLEANGGMGRRGSVSGSTTLEVGLNSVKGAGSNGLTMFRGYIYIMDVDKIFDSKNESDHSMILITGHFQEEVRGPRNSEGAKVHNNKYN